MRSSASRIAARVATAVLALACGADPGEDSAPPAASPEEVANREAWEAMIASEERIMALAPALRTLSRSVRNLALPDPTARGLFGAAVSVTDLAAPSGTESASTAGGVTRRAFTAGSPAPPVGAPDLSLWRPLFDAVSWFDDASFAAVRGHFLGSDGNRFALDLAFSGRARLATGSVAQVRASVEVAFDRSGDGDDAPWRITEWRTRSADWVETGRPFFREVLDTAISDPAIRAEARRSRHAEMALRRLEGRGDFEKPHPWFFVGSQDRHPGVAVADVDGDGWDDVYVMPRFGRNQLFVNRRDGTFEERAAELGLDLEDHASSAIFADFDNDGDPDVFVGRTLASSVYLENVDGRFVDRSAAAVSSPGALPSLVGSVSAADLDSDGLLDIYVSTYAAQMIVQELVTRRHDRQQTGLAGSPRLLERFLEASQGERLWTLTGSRDAHEFLALPGPPNVWLRNVGSGRFEVAGLDGPLSAWRNTYQATFADYDRDGDPDVYLAHDFAPNQLLRNDGEGRFSDVTEQTGTADIGFGMGASWGDYDGDGREDLYVSNMYSKAGKRITQAIRHVDPRLQKMARGNTLFRNAGDRFESVSGTGEGDARVEVAGWSWGGQLADFDNDGDLDVYVLSGYYTSPLEAEGDVDI